MPATAERTLAQLLSPSRFTAMSGKMAALVGCIIGEHFSEPQLLEIMVTSDCQVLARRKGDIGFNEFIGSESDFRKNWCQLLTAAGLTVEQRRQAEDCYWTTVKHS